MSANPKLPPHTKVYFICLLEYRAIQFLLCTHRHSTKEMAWKCIEKRRKEPPIPDTKFIVRETWERRLTVTTNNIDYFADEPNYRRLRHRPPITFSIIPTHMDGPVATDAFIDTYYNGVDLPLTEITKQINAQRQGRKKSIPITAG